VSDPPKVARPLTALFVAEVVSTTGSEMAAVALPWFVLVTTGSPARMGLVMAAEFVGMAVFGVPSGHVATALGPRRTMLASDLLRAPLVALIPALHWTGSSRSRSSWPSGYPWVPSSPPTPRPSSWWWRTWSATTRPG